MKITVTFTASRFMWSQLSIAVAALLRGYGVYNWNMTMEDE